jgi:hypothetical protein
MEVVAIAVVILAVVFRDRLAMAAAFLLSADRRAERELQWLHVKLKVLKAVAREIGKAETELKDRQ